MKCPHCQTDLKYKERSGKTCSSCKREFAFEPKTHALGLHDAKFRRVADKLSANGKLYFTAGQMMYFLSKNKIQNSNRLLIGFLIFLTIAFVVVTIFLILTPFVFVSVPAVVIFIVLLVVFWNREGYLSLPHSISSFERDDLPRWRSVYQMMPPQLIDNRASLKTLDPKEIRGVLLCPELEILDCLTANGIAEKLGLLLISSNQAQEKNKFGFIRTERNLPIFVLHDASDEGCVLKNDFVRKFLGGDKKRPVFDIGLRPKSIINSNKMRLRGEGSPTAAQNLTHLEPEEIEWLKRGNYTPLLSLTPTQLIKLVTRSVKRGFEIVGKRQPSAEKAAEKIGFMSWLGN